MGGQRAAPVRKKGKALIDSDTAKEGRLRIIGGASPELVVELGLGGQPQKKELAAVDPERKNGPGSKSEGWNGCPRNSRWSRKCGR